MKIIVCLDDNNGMLFNNRRQSRDSVLVDRIVSGVKDERLNVFQFSEKLFSEYSDRICVVSCIDTDGVYFIENVDISQYSQQIDEVVVYKWNRVYPADFYCNMNFSDFNIKAINEFSGSSHEKITEIIYGR